jgi:hypothetical protein
LPTSTCSQYPEPTIAEDSSEWQIDVDNRIRFGLKAALELKMIKPGQTVVAIQVRERVLLLSLEGRMRVAASIHLTNDAFFPRLPLAQSSTGLEEGRRTYGAFLSSIGSIRSASGKDVRTPQEG